MSRAWGALLICAATVFGTADHARGQPAEQEPQDPPSASSLAPAPPEGQRPRQTNAGAQADDLISLLRVAQQGTPPPVPLAERRVPDVEWPTPFEGVDNTDNDGVPLAILPSAPSSPNAQRSAARAAQDEAPSVRLLPAGAPPLNALAPPQVAVSEPPDSTEVNLAGPAVPRPNPGRTPVVASAAPAATADDRASAPSRPQLPPRLPTVQSVTDTRFAGQSLVLPGGNPAISDPLLDTSVAAAAQADADVEDAAPAFPAEPYVFSGPSPAELARTLVRLQDDIARGSVAALSAQRVVLRRIAADFPAYPPQVWAEREQAKALLIYALSGGTPRAVRAAYTHGSLPEPFAELVRGALAYLEGRGPDARRALDPFDVDDVDPSVRGALALAKAALVVDEDAASADALLARARYAAPGTLVEEAALRRAALIAAERNDVEQFTRLVNRYLRKFRTSVYAGNFRRRVAAGITRMRFIEDPAAFERLDTMMEPMTTTGRRELHLLLARSAVEFGRETAGRLAAERALVTAEPGTLDHRRAQLYLAAANSVHPEQVDNALATLRTLEREGGLDPAEITLLNAAIDLAQSVQALPDPAPQPTNGGPAANADAVETEETITDDESNPFRIDPAIAARVNETIAAVDALLEKRP